VTTQGAWPIRPFAEVADYGVGKTPARANADYWAQSDQNVPWVSISDLAPYGLVTKTKETVSRKAFDEVFRAKLVPAGTLLMSFKLTIGRIATLGVPAAHNEAIISIYPRPGVHQRFLGYFLSQYDYADLQDRQIKGNTLNKSKIDRIPVPVPPEGEQRRVADLLDGLRHAIDLQDAVLVNLAQMKSAAMQHLFTRGLRQETQKETELGPVPESWDVSTINDVALQTQYGLSIRGQAEGAIPILRMNCQDDGRVRFRDLQYVDLDEATLSAFRLEDGDLLFNRTNSIEHVGRTAIFDGVKEAVFASYLVRLKVDTLRCLPRFLNYYMNRREVQHDIKRLASRAVGQANINATKLRTIAFPLPSSLNEQAEIIEILDALDHKIDLHRRKRDVLDQLFKSLLHKLMTGQISVDDLDLSALPSTHGTAA